MAIYTFNTAVNPPGANWGTINNFASNGTNWIGTAGVSCQLETPKSYLINSLNTLKYTAQFSAPSTNVSYCGMTVNGTTQGNIWLVTHWEPNNGRYEVGLTSGSWQWTDTGIEGGTTINAEILVKGTGVKVTINGVIVVDQPYTYFNGQSVSCGFQKYTESTPITVYNGSIDYSSAQSAQPSFFLNMI